MNFDDLIAKVDQQRICFLCSTCKHYHEGEDRNLKDNLDQQVCSNFACEGPIWGGGFVFYDGPLKGYLHNWCYLCGREANKVLKASTNNAVPVGVCNDCYENHVKKYVARVNPKGYSVLVAERLVKDDKKFEVSS